MKDSGPFLSGILPDATFAALQAVAEAPRASFSDQVELAGLDRTRDLKNADLCNIDVSYSDLRGFDLTGANLRGATGINVAWDSTTTLAGAELGGSIFAAKARVIELIANNDRASNILARLERASWADQLVWTAENLHSTGRYRDIAVPITEALFYRAKDEFLRAALLRYVAPRMDSRNALRDLLLAAISDQPETATVVRSALNLFRRHRMHRDPAIRQIVLALIEVSRSGIRTEAVQFLMRTEPTQFEIATIRAKAKSGDPQFGSLFVAETARRLGDAYDLITRDPETNATFAFKAEITPRTHFLIARRWLRAESSQEEKQQGIPLAQRRHGSWFHEREEVEKRGEQVLRMWEELAGSGISVKLVRDSIQSDLTIGYAIGGGGNE